MGADGRAGGDRPTTSRLSTTRLAAATAIAVLLGVGWWVGDAPPPSDRAAALPLPSGAPGTLARLPTVAAGELDARDRPPSGPVAPTAPVDYPSPAEILQFDIAGVEASLPERDGLLQRRAGVLVAGGGIDLSGPVPAGERFRVDFTCQGEGELRVTVAAPGGSRHRLAQHCDGSVASIEIVAATTGMAVILFQPQTKRLIGVAVQLVRR